MSKVKTPTANLVTVGQEKMKSYGTTVLKHRSIPSLIDGLKPVHRRILWSMYGLGLKPNSAFTKASKVVGEALGNYHPHGDAAIAASLETLVNHSTPSVEGNGNWGTITDGPAASRYVECRLSQYGWDNFFDPDYIGTIKMVPNYDSTGNEPLSLFSNTLNLLVNGSSGIAVGTNCSIPSFTLESINKCLVLALKGKLTAKKAYQHLEVDLKYEGLCEDNDGNREAMLSIIEKGVGTLTLTPDYEVEGHMIHIGGFPTHLRTGKVIKKVSALDKIDLVEDLCDHKDGDLFTVHIKKSVQRKDIQSVVDTVVKQFTIKQRYSISYLVEKLDEDGNEMIDFVSSGILEMMDTWLSWRRNVEKRSINLKIKALQDYMVKLDRMKLAHDKRDVLDKCRDQKDPGEWLRKALKIDKETSDYMLGLTVRQLTAISKRNLLEERAETQKTIKQHKADLKQIDVVLERKLLGKKK